MHFICQFLKVEIQLHKPTPSSLKFHDNLHKYFHLQNILSSFHKLSSLLSSHYLLLLLFWLFQFLFFFSFLTFTVHIKNLNINIIIYNRSDYNNLPTLGSRESTGAYTRGEKFDIVQKNIHQ